MKNQVTWTSAKDILRSFSFKAGTQPDRLAILASVWDKEVGHFSKHWRLSGVRRGVLYVSTSSPAAAQELQMRSPGILRGLNKYFKTGWIKAIKTAR